MSENVRLKLFEALSVPQERALKSWLQDPSNPALVTALSDRIQRDNPPVHRGMYNSIQLEWIREFIRLLTPARHVFMPPPGGVTVGEITFHYANNVWTIEYNTGNNFPFRLWREHTSFNISPAPLTMTIQIIGQALAPPPP